MMLMLLFKQELILTTKFINSLVQQKLANIVLVIVDKQINAEFMWWVVDLHIEFFDLFERDLFFKQEITESLVEPLDSVWLVFL